MAQPVWILSVDLQAKTATFQSGMADAARSARGAFDDIGGGAEGMGRRMGHGMTEARHSVMMLGEEFGVHIPRALAGFIASLGPVGAALEAAFPFMAVILGATLLIEHLNKLHEAGEKLTEDQIKFGTAAQNGFNALDKKILEAEKHADELRGDHLGALQKQLELIDKESMDELVHSFEAVAKAADVVMKDLEGHWYTFGKGSDGAKAALDHFQTEYNSLLAQGKQEAASGLLWGTLKQATDVKQALQDFQAYRNASSSGMTDDLFQKGIAAQKVLKDIHVETGVALDNQVAAQNNLVQSLEAQVNSETRIATLGNLQKGNATGDENKRDSHEADAAARKRAEEEQKAAREFLENTKRDNDAVVEATEAGTMARVQALQAAMTDVAALYGVESQIYKHYAAEEVKAYQDTTQQQLTAIGKELDEEDRLKAEGAREAADNAEKMGQLALAAERQRMTLEDSSRRVTTQQRIAEDTRIADEEYRIKMSALDQEITGLDKSGKDYLNRLTALQDKEKQLTQQHENELTAIRQKAEIETNQRVLASFQQFQDSISHGLAQSITGHQSWAKMLQSLGSEVVSGAIQNAIALDTAEGMKRLSAAKTAGAKGMEWGWEYGGPAAPVLAPILGVAAFAATMAFAEGTDRVPGVGRGDVVPAMLSPGEGVVPGGVMDGLRNMARSGGFDQKSATVVHFRPTYHVQTIDGDGWGKALEKHADQTQRHIERTIRRLNK
jgi:hypothetical protein